MAFPDLGGQLWARYKASSEAGADGDPIVPQDISGNARHLTQATASLKPLLKTGIAGGKSVYRFDGVDDFCNVPDMSALTAGTGFVVVKIVTDPPAVESKAGLWRTDASTDGSHLPYIDGVIYDAFGSTARKTTVNPALSLSSAFRIYDVVSAAGDWRSYLDRTLLFSTATNTVGFSATGFVGKSTGSTTHFLDGDLAEVIFYSTALSTADRLAVETYLDEEYKPPFSQPYTRASMRVRG